MKLLNKAKGFYQNLQNNLFLKSYKQRIVYDVENAINFMTIMHGDNLSANARYTMLPMLLPLYIITFSLGLTRLLFASSIGLITNAIALYLETKIKTEFALQQFYGKATDHNLYDRIWDIFLSIDKHTHSSDPTVVFDTLQEFAKIKLASDETLGHQVIHGEHTVANAIDMIQTHVFANSKPAHILSASPYWNRIKYNFSQATHMLQILWNNGVPKSLFSVINAGSLVLSALMVFAYHATIGWLTTYIGLSIERAAYVNYALEKKGALDDKDKAAYKALYETLYDIIDVENHTTDLGVISGALSKLSTIKAPHSEICLGDIKLDNLRNDESYDSLCSADNISKLKQSFFHQPEDIKIPEQQPVPVGLYPAL